MPTWYDESLILLHYDCLLTSAATAPPGSGLDHEQLTRVLERVHPDAVQYTAKGNAGYVPYRSRYGNEALSLGQEWADVLSLYREVTSHLGIRLVLGYSGLIDYHAADWRPDWQRIQSDYAYYRNRALCPNSGYVDELMLPQLEEMLEAYSPDGIWIDADNWTVAPCYCTACESEFRMRHGRPMPMDRHDSFWPEWLQFHRDSFERYVSRTARFLQDRGGALVYASNGGWSSYQPERCPFGPDRLTRDLSPAFSLRQAGMEARFFAGRGLPFDLMTWNRCSARPWPGRLPALPAYPKTLDHLCQEGAVILANGGRWTLWSTPNVDDSLPEAEHGILAEAAGWARERQEWCHGGRSAAYVAVLHSEATHRKAGNGLFDPGPSLDRVRGAHQALLELHLPHDLLSEDAFLENLDRYPVVILPEPVALPPSIDEPLTEWVRRGGRLIASGRVSPRELEEIPVFALEEALGVRWTGRIETEGYFLAEGQPLHVAAPVYPVSLNGAETLVPLLLPGEAEAEASSHPGVSRHLLDEGEAYYLAADFFAAYHRCQYPGFRGLLGKLLARALPRPVLRTDAPPTVEVVLREKDGRTLLHLVNHSPGKSLAENSAFIEAVPLTQPFEMTMSRGERPASVRLQPGGHEPEWTFEDGRLTLIVPPFHIHTVLVVE